MFSDKQRKENESRRKPPQRLSDDALINKVCYAFAKASMQEQRQGQMGLFEKG